MKGLLKRKTRYQRFVKDVTTYTPFTKLILLLIGLWLLFAAGLYFAEHDNPGATVTSYGEALYWGIAAFTTAGIADTPSSGLAQLIGGTWIVVGSLLFFGGIVAIITGYFNRPLQRPHKKIIDTIEYNLEQMDDLSIEELDLLRETVDTLIEHVEALKEKHRTK